MALLLATLLLAAGFLRPCVASGPVLLLPVLPLPVLPLKGGPPKQQPSSIRWLSDYDTALEQAQTTKKMTLLLFYDPQTAAKQTAFKTALAADPSIARLAKQFIFAELPITAAFSDQGKTKRLLDFEAFAELQNQAGIAMIDYRDSEKPHYELVVSIYPFLGGAFITAEHFALLLDLPAGSLTQRALIFAVRSHPDKPASANGDFHPALATACQSHCLHQARIEQQGHHDWERRFHRLNALLPPRMVSREVCSESWPRQRLFQAARECVSSWRHSSGHWRAVNSKQSHFAFDMKQGDNGVWYATGIFARPD